MVSTIFRSFAALTIVLATGWIAAPIEAQTVPPGVKLDPGPFGQLGGGGANSQRVFVKARIVDIDGRSALLEVTTDVESGWHIYTLRQKPGATKKSVLTIASGDHFQFVSKDPIPFVTSKKPKIHREDFWPGIDIEEFSGTVKWRAPIEFAKDVDIGSLTISGTLLGQVCSDGKGGTCNDYLTKFAVKIDRSGTSSGGDTSGGVSEFTTGEIVIGKDHPKISGSLTSDHAAPGQTVQMKIRVEPAAGWHVYAFAAATDDPVSQPTLLAPTSGNEPRLTWSLSKVEGELVTKKVTGGHIDRLYQGPVEFTVDIQVPDDMPSGDYTIAGIIGYQTCKELCLAPSAVSIAVDLKVGETSSGSQADGASVPLRFVESSYKTAKEAARATTLSIGIEDSIDGDQSILKMLGIAFLAGLILNVMPCVLPVIGLKVMSFAQQAGGDRKKIFMLNLWYVLGLMAVFMVLAGLAAFASMGWGAQFSSVRFVVIMAALVFAFALSFLGVWEIPIPGFVGSGKASELSEKEGPSGAFFKGVLTTILATPCSGPFLGTALTWAVQQPQPVIFATFASMGLGMASPFLVIGANPSLIRFLPKPGAWMETFKHIMGFVLLGTVVWIIHPLERQEYLAATIALLFAVWAALWWVGRVPITADLSRKLRSWAGGAAFATVIGVFAFTQMVPRDETTTNLFGKTYDLPWETYERAKLQKYLDEGKTVLVDFSADW